MSTAVGVQSPLRRAVRSLTAVGPLPWAITSLTVDRALTITHWTQEANPLVVALGPIRWMAVTLVLVLGLIATWEMGARESWVAHVSLWLLTMWYGVVTVGNTMALAGWL